VSQPVWRCVANLGDRDPLDHGGLFVYVDRTGVYPPEMERVEPDEDGSLEVRRVVLDRYHPNYPAWYAKDIGSVASFVGCDPEELCEDLCGSDPIPRAEAYRGILDYFGWDNGDDYPLTITVSEARQRYRNEMRRIRRGGL